MLKAKTSTYSPRGKAAAMEAIRRSDNQKGLYAKLPPAIYKRLKVELANLEMTFHDWVIKQIEEM